MDFGTPSNAGIYAALCNLREAVPYAFGYMMSAKVGTGIVAELGAMRTRAGAALASISGALPRTVEALLRYLPTEEGLLRAS